MRWFAVVAFFGVIALPGVVLAQAALPRPEAIHVTADHLAITEDGWIATGDVVIRSANARETWWRLRAKQAQLLGTHFSARDAVVETGRVTLQAGELEAFLDTNVVVARDATLHQRPETGSDPLETAAPPGQPLVIRGEKLELRSGGLLLWRATVYPSAQNQVSRGGQAGLFFWCRLRRPRLPCAGFLRSHRACLLPLPTGG